MRGRTPASTNVFYCTALLASEIQLFTNSLDRFSTWLPASWPTCVISSDQLPYLTCPKKCLHRFCEGAFSDTSFFDSWGTYTQCSIFLLRNVIRYSATSFRNWRHASHSGQARLFANLLVEDWMLSVSLLSAPFVDVTSSLPSGTRDENKTRGLSRTTILTCGRLIRLRTIRSLDRESEIRIPQEDSLPTISLRITSLEVKRHDNDNHDDQARCPVSPHISIHFSHSMTDSM
jgi:hypothetical protein